MNRAVLARNIRILRQIDKVAQALEASYIPVVLLKGSALIELVPSYIAERVMEDIDLLVRPRDVKDVRSALFTLGYTPAFHDPWAFCRPDEPAYIDIIDHLWYLDRKENEDLFAACHSFPIDNSKAFHLPPSDFYVHVLAHAAAHHGRMERKWFRDLELIRQRWGRETGDEEVRKKLRRYGFEDIAKVYLSGGMPVQEEDLPPGRKFLTAFYRRLTERGDPRQGHVLRFVLLPHSKKLPYLLAALFPPSDFVRYRYSVKKNWQVHLYRCIRPLLLIFQLVSFLFKKKPAIQ